MITKSESPFLVGAVKLHSVKKSSEAGKSKGRTQNTALCWERGAWFLALMSSLVGLEGEENVVSLSLLSFCL